MTARKLRRTDRSLHAPCRCRAVGSACRYDDAGAAIVDFVFISVLLVLLLFGVLQVALYFYARNVVASAAADAARYAAAAGVTPATADDRAAQLIRQGIGTSSASDIACTTTSGVDSKSSLPIVTVHCTGRLRALLVPFHLPVTLDVRSSALREQLP